LTVKRWIIVQRRTCLLHMAAGVTVLPPTLIFRMCWISWLMLGLLTTNEFLLWLPFPRSPTGPPLPPPRTISTPAFASVPIERPAARASATTPMRAGECVLLRVFTVDLLAHR
jgi:hypothetical protein